MSSEPNKDYVDGWYVNEEDVPVPDWHLAIINERMERFQTEDRRNWRTWEEVEKELLEAVAKSLKH